MSKGFVGFDDYSAEQRSVQAAEERRRKRQLEEEEEGRAYKRILAEQQQLGEGDHLLDSSSSYTGKHPPPNVFGAFFYGFLLLCTSVGFYYAYTKVLLPEAEDFFHHFPLTVLFLGFISLAFVSSFGVILRTFVRACKSSEPEHISHLHVGWACITEAFIVGIAVLFWYLDDLGMCSGVFNQCAVIFSVDLILLVLLTLPWYHERTDIPMALFVFVIGAATTLLLWDESQKWEWDDFKTYYKQVLVAAGIVIASALAAMSLRKSMSHGDTSYIHLLFVHTWFGTYFSIAPVLGIEVIPNWSDGWIFHFVTWTIAWRLIVCFGFVIVFLYALKGLSRYSDALTTGYSAKLAALLPHVTQLIESLVNGDKFQDWSAIKISAFCIALACIAYWFIRIPLLHYCWRRKHKNFSIED